MSLIYFPIFDFLVLATVNYLGMGMTFFPRMISIKKEHGVITFACTLRISLRSIVDLLLFATFIGLMIGVAYNGHASFGILSGLAASIIFIPTTLLSAIGFWIYGERVRVLSKSKP